MRVQSLSVGTRRNGRLSGTAGCVGAEMEGRVLLTKGATILKGVRNENC